ncbi:MAG: sucrase ferredoxin [Nitriliruptor sp.]|uniref:sucrase ferredoxin n=1 Tax=Nitriliruptor sp. TaxID=2448056 RepID=UPI0034A018CB
MHDDAPTCALLTRQHEGQVAGTAPVAAGWVLIEQPGSWGRKALTSSGLDPAVGAALDEASGDEVRVQLVRRPGLNTDRRRTLLRRTVVLAHTGATPWAEQLEVDDAQLAALDPTLAASPTPPGLGMPVAGPLLLVCTHGKRDRCCATYGRPIADALAALHGDAVWEVSHVGGHRFAGNLVCLPDGAVYGALRVAHAVRTLDLHLAGRFELGHLRGRSGLPRPAQAAEVLVRRQLGLDGHAAVQVGAVSPADPADPAGDVSVELVLEGGRRHLATVRQVPTGVSYAMSCDSDDPVDPGRWVLI